MARRKAETNAISGIYGMGARNDTDRRAGARFVMSRSPDATTPAAPYVKPRGAAAFKPVRFSAYVKPMLSR